MKDKMNYIEKDGIFYPDIKMPKQKEIGKWGLLHLGWLKCKYRSRYPTGTAFCSHRAGLSAPLSRKGAPLLHINPRRSFSTAIAACRREPVGKSGGGCRLYVSENSVSFILGELQSHST